MIEDLVNKEEMIIYDETNPPFRECVDYGCDLYKKKTDDYDPCKKEICPRLS